MRTVAALFVVAVWSGIAPGQTKNNGHTLSLADGTKPAAGMLADVAWLAGNWAGPGLGGQCEEIWTPPLAGCKEMMGMFRCVRDGKIVISEHCVLCESEGSIVLKIRHFDPAFNAREEKDKPTTFKLVKLDKGAAYFDGLTIQKTNAGCTFYVALHTKNGLREAKFEYKKAEAK
ncbi:MAG TPA: DUF6265 family protein [Fimbriiglobus sp.]|jgi:hypothetical protein